MRKRTIYSFALVFLAFLAAGSMLSRSTEPPADRTAEAGRPESGAINTEHSEGDLHVAPDQSYIVFVSSGRDESIGAGDLYVSFRARDGSWGEGINLGETINSRWTEYCPTVSPDGRYLFFTSYRMLSDGPPAEPLTHDAIERAYGSPQSGLGDVYWVDAAVLEAVRSRD